MNGTKQGQQEEAKEENTSPPKPPQFTQPRRHNLRSHSHRKLLPQPQRLLPSSLPNPRTRIPNRINKIQWALLESKRHYLDPNFRNEDLPTGVSFASGGTGNDLLTAQMQGVLSLSAQLKNFQEYIGRLKALVGEERTNYIISNSLYLVSSGNNDIAITYANSPLRQQTSHTFPFICFPISFLGLRFPQGCLPGGRTAAGGPLRLCADIVNGQAQLFNSQLSSAVTSLQATLSGSTLRFVDVYDALLNIIQNPFSSGFLNVANGCCGTGLVEIGVTYTLAVGSYSNPGAYFFWDASHQTQRAYQLIVSSKLHQSTHHIVHSK
ncbi:hypothetical protein PIB30_051623 [Stylosanthes scabra]|uniref:GDSL esterase/lipase n=1 Tax=Stylosanthes scabra TaxID=79078 RepID=A0ABU6THR8_9FABA|nr:hypothetical protein [Stylosanthes scabra]